jgi:hypothetical protein
MSIVDRRRRRQRRREMSGYDGYSKSNNAVAAESAGRYPLSHAIKAVAIEIGVTRSVARDALEAVSPCEWHHSSKLYNEVLYYSVGTAVRYIRLTSVRDLLTRDVRAAMDAVYAVYQSALSRGGDRLTEELAADVEIQSIACGLGVNDGDLIDEYFGCYE